MSGRSAANVLGSPPAEGIVAPVILCGGAGTRLWPASTPGLPKPFAALVEARSGFQDALCRGMAVARGSPVLVVGAAADHSKMEAQASEVGAGVRIVLEPGGRSSAPAMAAAALLIAETDPAAVLVVLSADHHVTRVDAFVDDIASATEAARAGAIVILGAPANEPSTAFGYIHPGAGDGPAKPVLAFVEKPDAQRASRYVAEGFLWNTGMFVFQARTLLGELERYAPEVLGGARKAFEHAAREGGVTLLGPAFLESPTISIDHAVMEKTALAKVVPARFGWADLGAWDAVWAASPKDALGNAGPPDAVFVDARDVLARAPPGVRVGVVGLERMAVIVEPGAVLVCALDRAQEVKQVAVRMAMTPPRAFSNLAAARLTFDRWMRASALPLWCSVGADHEGGGFHERLTLEGQPSVEPRRMLVQARQAYAYAIAGRTGWTGPWRQAVVNALDYIERYYRLPSGLYGAAYSPSDQSLSSAARTYDQAFALLAWAAARKAGIRADRVTEQAVALRDALADRATPAGSFREIGEAPFQANANMHLFEAVLSWAELDAAGWGPLVDAIGSCALTRFFDRDRGVLHEFYDEHWNPEPGEQGRLIEPGHQFEWAFLFSRWAELGGPETAKAAAGVLFEAGRRGVDRARGVAINAMRDDFEVVDASARLWPQAERLRAALAFGDNAEALDAANGLWPYFETAVPGLWRDRLLASDAFVDEPARASSLYHLVGAWEALKRA